MMRTAETVAIGSGFSTTTAALDIAAAITANALPWKSDMSQMTMPPVRPDPEIPRPTIESRQSRDAVMAFLDPDDALRWFKPGDVVYSLKLGLDDYCLEIDGGHSLLAHPRSLVVADGPAPNQTPLGIMCGRRPDASADGIVYMPVVVQGVCRVHNCWLAMRDGEPGLDSAPPPGTELRVGTAKAGDAGNFLSAVLMVYDEPASLVYLR